MVQIEKGKVVIEIEEPFPGDYIRELHKLHAGTHAYNQRT